MQLSRRDALLSVAAGVAVFSRAAAAAKPTSGTYPGPAGSEHQNLTLRARPRATSVYRPRTSVPPCVARASKRGRAY